jgi:hypothetical protein
MSKKPVLIQAGPRGRKPQRLVIAISDDTGEEIHRDTIDTNSALSRKRFIHAVARNGDLVAADLGWLGPVIIEQADKADDEAMRNRDGLEARFHEEERKSVATQLVKLAASVELFHCPDGTAYASFPVDGHEETANITSRSFRQWLSSQFHTANKKVANSQALQDAIGVLEGKAILEGEQQVVNLRVAEHDDSIILDLCNESWQVVRVDINGWQVLDKSPVKFRRAKAMQSLPIPTQGKLKRLRKFLNIGDVDWSLVAAWLVTGLRPGRPFPVLCLHGEQGAAKSTTARVLRSLIDPNYAPVRAEPRNPHDLMIAAKNGWAIVLDNLSYLRPWLSDALCRLSTGGGFSTRKLYENDEEIIFDAMRPMILTGIEEVATRGDLVDRSLLVHLQAIPETLRVSEAVFWDDFEQAWPSLLGGLLNAASTAMQRLPEVQIDRLPRMADFATWAIAAEPAMGLEVPFLDAYSQNRSSANELAMEASSVAKYILDLMEGEDQWKGTATELLEALNSIASDQDRQIKGWPKTARKLGGDMMRLAPNLRKIGIDVENDRTSRRRCIQLTRINADSCVTNVINVMDPDITGSLDDARVTQIPAGTRIPTSCNHQDPTTWYRRDGKAYCSGCDKFIGRDAG